GAHLEDPTGRAHQVDGVLAGLVVERGRHVDQDEPGPLRSAEDQHGPGLLLAGAREQARLEELPRALELLLQELDELAGLVLLLQETLELDLGALGLVALGDAPLDRAQSQDRGREGRHGENPGSAVATRPSTAGRL